MSIRILERLHNEWQHLTIHPAELAAIRGWTLPGNQPQSLDDVLVRAGYRYPRAGRLPGGCIARPFASALSSSDGEAADVYLLCLVRLAGHDRLAARIVLQRILPGLSAVARRHTIDHRRPEVLDDLVSNSWSVIRAYPVERRPRQVAVNLVRDIAFQTLVRPSRRRAATAELPLAFEPLVGDDGERPDEPLHELLEVVRAAHRARGINDDDLELIRDLLRHPRTTDVAAARQVTARTVRNHRDAVVYRLQRYLQEANLTDAA